MNNIIISKPQSDADILQMLELQKQNLRVYLSPEEKKSQGFVTVEHDFGLLKKMNDACPHIVAKDGNKLVAYALVMLPAFQDEIEILKPMFEKLKKINWRNKAINTYKHFIMGQVCIHKSYRGIGIFDLLYTGLKEQMEHNFELCITEVSTHNQRSLKAHYRVGFKNALHYTAPNGEEWELIVWNWK